ncbi:hypothetical protein [Actinomycetospora cinnamomea]|uniref:Uncharacterized protein n=1 Tax=Actinomycetospora cinnamomea TaxID=663609 RepID=A0A2U1EWJ1_9PSEU|nr:hypothetical protein [Actinomycetospora cinnamomea]PVZ04279.1 hypothetical protein C8D89_11867 [Actinomycetospora cinnamomea]
MKTLALALGGLAVWVAAPTVAMAAHGTIDQRTRAAWRARAAHAGVPAPAPVVAIPAQRGADAGTRATARVV